MKQKRNHKNYNSSRPNEYITPIRTCEVREEYNKNAFSIFKEVEVLVRKQQRLQSVKLICSLTGMGLVDGKEAIDKYIETGIWSHISVINTSHVTLVETIFTKVFGTSPSEKNKTSRDVLTVSETLRFAKKYGEALLLSHKDDVWDYIKKNYYITPKIQKK